MKKKNFTQKLMFRKTKISTLKPEDIIGGRTGYFCEPIDLSVAETCISDCDLTVTCTQYSDCNDYSFANCTVYNCGGTTGGGGGTGGNSGGISCPGYVC
ncbi:hypothetical protein C8N46_106233 [Kordia periserrulae]|uniref:Uncharacterized protein n=1 Tax=Kordia periserrulae TaxID=701523 RepID=A0A2T6BX97_9FLAO|nr:hypothetical protein [Kordia periserrulae]PTX60587.1 hypothetical protein C8N46_106233 [Kordia periserrulae]